MPAQQKAAVPFLQKAGLYHNGTVRLLPGIPPIDTRSKACYAEYQNRDPRCILVKYANRLKKPPLKKRR